MKTTNIYMPSGQEMDCTYFAAPRAHIGLTKSWVQKPG